ncbi:MAG: LysE family translocator [Ilumatobacter sp.]|uniref:LysE family translocator n=1 Tax=Ilumatobacter sp. TaxID=1967498 RepID=UPI002615A43E|nr:LysE family translocator [Ilumatobacter sp.]MDJ0767603.1 LysE family translocator [Ilumatobacter sp.]
MPTSGSLVAFAALSFALIVVPGPSVMFVVGRAVALGRRAALLTVAGNAAGVYVQVLLVAVGLGAVVERSVAAFTIVKLFGAAYLVWLGVQAIRRRRHLAAASEPAGAGRTGRSVFRDGLVVGLANPKAIVFFAAILPQYVDRGGAPAPLQMAFLGVVFVAIALLSDGAWGLAAGTARNWFSGSPRRLERLGLAGGCTMIGLGIHLAVSGRSD